MGGSGAPTSRSPCLCPEEGLVGCHGLKVGMVVARFGPQPSLLRFQPARFMSIYVGNVPFTAEKEDIQELFAYYGEVARVSLPLDRDTGRKRGFAFVDMVKEVDEQSAIDDLQDVEWMGRAIRVRKAEPRGGGASDRPRRGERSTPTGERRSSDDPENGAQG
ncbi:RNA-binding region RNP-1 (RNA recognition motif) [Candidatus Synechococcus spongiarum]|uniref:RNA-binding region RNP-1 (RNA recognition motif) n=2 Tax=Candidatus Synechococcus spongiarum TaxID=431041 RepID=A0A165AET8_9SYNE|nr:RNA-binding region RNP-1 (RNA recognition motif) [Candidatus Synechococcus spongiarum]